MSRELDVLVLAAHPDDAEIGCGGTIMSLLEAGRQVAIVDMTQGEMGTRGSPEERAAECAKATAMLGVSERRNLRLPDAGLRDDDEALWAVIEVLRELRPRLFLVPLIHDAHPDHEATGRIAKRAFFLSGLKNYHPKLGSAHRPAIMLSYFGNDYQDPPSFCVDIGRWVQRKRDVVSCYSSQVGGKDKSHFLRGLDPLDRTEARDRFFGANCGYQAAEPFVHDGPIPLADLSSFLPAAP